MKTKLIIYVLVALTITDGTQAQPPESNTVPVTIENYNRAQTDVYFAGVVKNGGFGQFRHGRELAPPVQKGIVRPNRDTLYGNSRRWSPWIDLMAAGIRRARGDGSLFFLPVRIGPFSEHSVKRGLGNRRGVYQVIGP